MTELGDLLELLHGAGGRWRTAAVAVHRWCDSEQVAVAWRRAAEREHGRSGTVSARGSGPCVWEMETRMWIDRPGHRSRQETSGPHGDTLTVCVGRTWWSYHPHIGATSNEHEPEVGGGGPGDVEWLLDPAPLIPAFDFAVMGSTEVAGRPALHAQARSRPGAGWPGTPVLWGFTVASGYYRDLASRETTPIFHPCIYASRDFTVAFWALGRAPRDFTVASRRRRPRAWDISRLHSRPRGSARASDRCLRVSRPGRGGQPRVAPPYCLAFVFSGIPARTSQHEPPEFLSSS